ncbi:MAG: hypothetical protein JWQ14_765 [Adhaeribacter sp.]|jgi:hypothetical protein|nr:hypothetical protein [Adhaeribacter sp.]
MVSRCLSVDGKNAQLDFVQAFDKGFTSFLLMKLLKDISGILPGAWRISGGVLLNDLRLSKNDCNDPRATMPVPACK